MTPYQAPIQEGQRTHAHSLTIVLEPWTNGPRKGEESRHNYLWNLTWTLVTSIVRGRFWLKTGVRAIRFTTQLIKSRG